MIDMHYDMLSVAYQCYKRDDYSYLEKWIQNYRDENVSGVFMNLYFMNPEEMKKELGAEAENIDVLEMFKVATKVIRRYLPDKKLVFSIEGCDYIKDTKELEELYKEGLASMLLVWNNPNKYGCGIRGDDGLTKAGRELLEKAIDLGIIIDMSHMNRKTFYDVAYFLREQIKLGKKVKVIASHSNSYKLCSHPRNLDDAQLQVLKELDAIVGVVSYSRFISTVDEDTVKLRQKYLEHIKHIVSIVGIDHVGVSTDDMTFGVELFGDEKEPQVFDYATVKRDLRELLEQDFSKNEIEMILEKNIFRKLVEE